MPERFNNEDRTRVMGAGGAASNASGGVSGGPAGASGGTPDATTTSAPGPASAHAVPEPRAARRARGIVDVPSPADDTEARWEPMSDEEWAMTTAFPADESDTAAAAAVDEWLEPQATIVRPRPAAPAASSASAPGDTAPGPRIPVAQAPQAPAGGAVEPDNAAFGAEPTGRGASPRAPRRWKHAKHGCLSLLLWLIMLVVLGMMALRELPPELANGRMVPEVVSFIPWLFAPILVCLVLAALWRRRLLLVVCLAALAAMCWWHRGYLLPEARVSDGAAALVQSTPNTQDSVARIMTLNTKNGGASAEEVVALVREKNVEVLCMQELSDEFLDELAAAGLYDLLPYYVISDEASAISNGGRNGIWTMAPMYNISGNLLPIETSSMPAGTIMLGDLAVRVVSVHPNSPVRGAQDLWDEGLSVIGSLSDYSHTYLVMGDFNSTWEHSRFRKLLGSSFVDAGQASGEGFHMTYPSGWLPSLIEIDHILYARDSGIVVSGLETAQISGTDHKALLGVLEAV